MILSTHPFQVSSNEMCDLTVKGQLTLSSVEGQDAPQCVTVFFTQLMEGVLKRGKTVCLLPLSQLKKLEDFLQFEEEWKA